MSSCIAEELATVICYTSFLVPIACSVGCCYWTSKTNVSNLNYVAQRFELLERSIEHAEDRIQQQMKFLREASDTNHLTIFKVLHDSRLRAVENSEQLSGLYKAGDHHYEFMREQFRQAQEQSEREKEAKRKGGIGSYFRGLSLWEGEKGKKDGD